MEMVFNGVRGNGASSPVMVIGLSLISLLLRPRPRPRPRPHPRPPRPPPLPLPSVETRVVFVLFPAGYGTAASPAAGVVDTCGFLLVFLLLSCVFPGQFSLQCASQFSSGIYLCYYFSL